jgi:hypothetical protein
MKFKLFNSICFLFIGLNILMLSQMLFERHGWEENYKHVTITISISGILLNT